MTETMNVEGEASFLVDTTDPKGKDKDKTESKKWKAATKVLFHCTTLCWEKD